MVIDSNSDRYLSNSNKTLRVINGGQLNAFAEKSLPTNLDHQNIPANHQPVRQQMSTPLKQANPGQLHSNQQPIHPSGHPNQQPGHPNQHNHTNNCLNQHNHHNHIRGECNVIPSRPPNEPAPEAKMNHTPFNDKANLLQKNNLLKDSNQSINLPILGKTLDDSEDENDDILEISPCGRWSKRREQVVLFPNGFQWSSK